MHQLDYLKFLCEAKIERYTDCSNALYLFQVADKFKAWQLRSFCLEFIGKHWEQLKNELQAAAGEQVEAMPPELLSEISRMGQS